jgi:stage II sporulation protein D
MTLLLALLWTSAALLAQSEISVHTQRGTAKLPLEQYVAGVLAGEVNTFQSQEALRAMAIVARTYAIRFRGRHKADGFDFCETTHCQDLRIEAVNQRVIQAAEETEGELLWYQGAPVAAFYHRHCGGRTEEAGALWPDMAAPYLRVQPDSYCIARGRDDWSATIRTDELHKALGAYSLQVVSRTQSGRVQGLRAGGREMTADTLHLAIGRTLGWHLLRSSSYEVFPTANGLVFQGYGSGHGVGLCQAGAERRGLERHTYRQILAFYYPGTITGLTARGFAWRYLGGERVDVFSTREHEDRELPVLAGRALQEAERRVGFSYSGRPRVKVFPTVASFRDATGEPGSVAASTAGSTIRLQPRAEYTLLHEMLHLVVESKAHRTLPDWYREGLVLYLAQSGLSPSPEYEAFRSRIAGLAATHGRDVVLKWLISGLPAHAADQSGQHQPRERSQQQREAEAGDKTGALRGHP